MNGGVPSQLPLAAVTVCPSSSVPRNEGWDVETGGRAETGAVTSEAHALLPALFAAVTRARSR